LAKTTKVSGYFPDLWDRAIYRAGNVFLRRTFVKKRNGNVSLELRQGRRHYKEFLIKKESVRGLMVGYKEETWIRGKKGAKKIGDVNFDRTIQTFARRNNVHTRSLNVLPYPLGPGLVIEATTTSNQCPQSRPFSSLSTTLTTPMPKRI